MNIRFFSFILILLLSSCSTTPDGDSLTSIGGSSTPASQTEESYFNSLLEQSSQANSPDAELFILEASEYLTTQKRYVEAIEILETIDTDSLELALATEITLAKAKIHLALNQPKLVISLLTSERLNALPQLPAPLQIEIRNNLADAYFLSNYFLESAQQRIYADKLLNDRALAQNHERIWNSLVSLPSQQLQLLALNEINFEFQGWYELAYIGKAFQYNLDQQLVELEKWRLSKTRHPASNYLPLALQLVEAMANERPDSIALLLPLDTNAGRIVRDGFMSAYFNVRDIGGKVPIIKFYNTSDTSDIVSLHRKAQDEGAAMVIGPLLKQNVALLQQNANLAVTTLALNNIEGRRALSDSFYQFSLAPEDEAVQMAQKAWRDGHRYVAILNPQISDDNDPFNRKRNRFIQEWQQLGGIIVAQENFLVNYTDSIEALLNLSDSEYRKETLSKLIGKSLEFTQRRRQDIDFIALFAPPAVARQVNPRLAYLYAGDIPVYASQDIYSGTPKPLEDTDLNGIIFSDSPWLLNNTDVLKNETQALFPQATARNLRLQAFGVDAFRLYPRLKQLSSSPESQIFGATGLLSLGDNNNIIRTLSWAKIEDGVAQLLDSAE